MGNAFPTLETFPKPCYLQFNIIMGMTQYAFVKLSGSQQQNIHCLFSLNEFAALLVHEFFSNNLICK